MHREKPKTTAAADPAPTPTTLVPPDQLLLNRVQTARALGLSTSSIIRLETEGQLTPVKLSRKPAAMTFYRRKFRLDDGEDNDGARVSPRRNMASSIGRKRASRCPRATPSIGSRDHRCVDQTPPRDNEFKCQRKPFKKWHFNG